MIESQINALQRIGEAEIQININNFVEEIEQIKSIAVKQINNADDFRIGSDFLGRAKSIIKILDERRTELKEPALTEGKRIDTIFKRYIDPLKEFKDKMERAMNSFALAEANRKEEAIRFAREQEVKRLEAEKQKMLDLAVEESLKDKTAQSECMEVIALSQAEAIEQDQINIENKSVHGIVKTLGADGSMSTSKEWTYEITNEKLIPREYCIPKDSLINKAVKDGVRTIAGVSIFEKARFSNR
jgi:hypothetical protein